MGCRNEVAPATFRDCRWTFYAMSAKCSPIDSMPTGRIPDHETLARFAYEESYFRRSDGTVKGKAFYPDSQGDCSVMVASDSGHSAIEAWANRHVTPHRGGKRLLGYALVGCADVRRAGLDAEHAEPPPLHGNLVGYPQDRAEWMQRALELASTATFTRI